MSYHSLTLLLNVELTRLSSILQGNLHHLMFPFRRLVVLDLDLVFEVNIDDLYREFESIERDDRLMAMTYDQSPFYTYELAMFHKKRPDIPVSFLRVR